jgi:hypothetical protein
MMDENNKTNNANNANNANSTNNANNTNSTNNASHIIANVPVDTMSISLGLGSGNHQCTWESQTFVPMIEYQRIKNINTENEHMIMMMRGQSDNLRQQIATSETLIHETRGMNQRYFQEIESMKTSIQGLVAQNQHNETRVHDLEVEFSRIRFNGMHRKFILAIQDLNLILNLESKIRDQGVLESLRRLKAKAQTMRCNYCCSRAQQNLIDARIHVMDQRIREIEPDQQLLLDTRYPGLLSEIRKSLDEDLIRFVNPCSDLVNDADQWWDE